MIRIVAELLPGGLSHGRRPIATMNISNISDLTRLSDYRVDIAEAENRLAGTALRSCTVYVRDHDRHQSIWRLVAAALRESEREKWDEI